MNILEEIYRNKYLEVEGARSIRSLEQLRLEAEQMPLTTLDFTAALRRPPTTRPRLIAEVKKASPSRGVLIEEFRPLDLARVYSENGAAAISVLTDQKYFHGHLDHLRQVAMLELRIPVLRKDFIFDPYQVYEARCAGASAILLIVAMLSAPQIVDLQALANQLGMAALIEIHDTREVGIALSCGAKIIGANNRNLKDLSVNVENAARLRAIIPDEVCTVAESGIQCRMDVDRLGEIGFDAVLVGETLVTASDIGAKVRSLAL